MLSVILGIIFKSPFQFYKWKIITYCCFNLRQAALMVYPSLAITREAWKYHYDDTLPKTPARLEVWSSFSDLSLLPRMF
jgi:hypothetical protein